MRKITEKIKSIRNKLADKLSAWIVKHFEIDDLEYDEYIESLQ